MSNNRLFSGRVKKKTGDNLDTGRTSYLDLANAEPDLGIPSEVTSVLAATTSGNRFWTTTIEVNVIGTVSTLDNFTSDDLVEGTTNLYVTADRAGDGLTFSTPTNAFTLSLSGVASGDYGSATEIPVFTVDEYGRITTATSVAVAGVSGFSYNTNTADLTISTADGGEYTATISLEPFVDADVTFNNVLITGTLKGPSTFVIDPAAYGDETGLVVIQGDLQVNGTSTIINSTTLDIGDLNILLATGAINPASATGAGITVYLGTETGATSLTYNGNLDVWQLDKVLDATVTDATENLIDNKTELFYGEVDSNSHVLILDVADGQLKKSTIYNAALQGPIGYTGSQGDIGYTGSQGDIGYTGSQGDIGYAGSQGDIGYTGSQGDIGYTGSQGDIGYTGSQGDIGYTGSAGQDGTIGVDGYTGSQGDIGYTGSQGDIGYTGSQGDIGYTGSQGDIGYTGSKGESSFTWGPTPPSSPAVGDRWYDTNKSKLVVYVDDGDSLQWVETAASGFLGRTGYTGSAGTGGGGGGSTAAAVGYSLVFGG